MFLKFKTWLVFLYLFACSFAYQGAIDLTKPQTFYPGAPAATASLHGNKGIVTIPRIAAAPGGVSNSPSSNQKQADYRQDLEVVYVGYAADGSPVLSIRPAVEQPVSSSPNPKMTNLVPYGRASDSSNPTSSGDDLMTANKYSDVDILRILLRLIRVLQRQQELEKSGKSTSSFSVLGYPRRYT